MLIARFVLVTTLIVAVNLLAASSTGSAATRLAGAAFSVAAGSPPTVANSAPSVTLPPAGGNEGASATGFVLGVTNGVGNADELSVSAIGTLGASRATVTTTSTIGSIELLAGLIRANDVRVVATASEDGNRASSSASVTFGYLSVAGLSYVNVRPNERVELPGVGYAILNEQLTGGDGRASASIVARAVRVVLTAPSLLDLGRGTEIIVASASAGVPDIDATRAVQPSAPPAPTAVKWAPISTRSPVDISFNGNGSGGGGNDNFDFGNSNGNGNTAKVATATAAPTATPKP